MISIHARGLSKSFNDSIIFDSLDMDIAASERVALLGPNGVGKSTLLKCLMGFVDPDKGEVFYKNENTIIKEDFYKYVAASAPYMQFETNILVKSLVLFYFRFKPLNSALVSKAVDILDYFEFSKHAHKKTSELSSGLLQRLKLILMFGTSCPVLFLDEPCTNLDLEGIGWFQKLVDNDTLSRTMIVASNRQEEYSFCSRHIPVTTEH